MFRQRPAVEAQTANVQRAASSNDGLPAPRSHFRAGGHQHARLPGLTPIFDECDVRDPGHGNTQATSVMRTRKLKPPKVSICMPVYNGGNYFRKALESALAQDYPDIEIVVVNDGSNDGGATEAIALEYGGRIRYFGQDNKGVAGALNTALKHATGDYFAWLSHDDIHLSHKTSAQIRYLEALGRPHACLFSDYDLIDPADELITTVRFPVERVRQTPRLPLMNGWINGCSLLIPMDLMRAFGPFDERLRYTQDYDLWSRILGEHEFFHQPEVLIRYRIHPEQDTQKQKVAPESDPLWVRMMSDRSATQRAQLYGSSFLYFRTLGEFLQKTPMLEAAEHALNKSRACIPDTLTSVIIAFRDEFPLVQRAVESALGQVGVKLEIILVDDGSTQDVSPIEHLVSGDTRLKLVRQPNRGVAAARNRGLLSAQGEYIAFLNADETFLPHKIQRQLDLMQQRGALVSHTSYYISYPEGATGLGLSRSGGFGGTCYPAIIGACPISLQTLMLHRSVVDEGFVLLGGPRAGTDLLTLADLASKYLLLGIDEPLSIAEWSSSTPALSVETQIAGLAYAISALESHPVHGQHTAQLEALRSAFTQLSRDLAQDADCPNRFRQRLIDIAWTSGSEIPAEAFGRTALY